MLDGYKTTRRRFIGRVAVITAALGICGPVFAQDATDWATVEAAAKEEGRVTFYNNLQPNGIEPLIAKFNEDYPDIAVEFIRRAATP